MTRIPRNKPLPNCEGPKLAPFADDKAAITFRKVISDSNLIDLADGGHAHVIEVSIRSRTYALKIFKYYDDTEDYAALFERQRQHMSIDLIRGHRDPFFNECRAYGRLIDNDLNGKVAVHCYGYLLIPASREEELQQKFGITAWNRPADEYLKPAAKRQPLRAIVKDLVTEDVPFTATIAKKMLRDLRRIRRCELYNMDVRARNYKGGLLVDFSVAMTPPHYLFVTKPDWRVRSFKLRDLSYFDRMLDEAGVETLDRATRNEEYVRKLRPRDDTGRVTKAS